MTVDASTPAATEVAQYIPVDLIDPAPTNRDLGTEASLRELADSIKSKGLLQPIIVSPKDSGRFEVVFGHRRLEAVKRAGMDTILSVVREYDEQERKELRLIENVLRKNPTPIEEATAYQELLDLNPKLNQAKLAKRLGIAQGTISRRLKLIALPRRLQDEINSGRIPAEDAYHLSKLTNHPNSEKLIKNARARAAELGITIEQAVIQVRDDLKNALKREMAKEDLDKRGVKLAPKGWERTGWRLGYEEGMLQIDPYEHQTEPCHAALINDAGMITYVCTDPKRHEQGTSSPEASDGQPTGTDAETAEPSAEEAEQAEQAAAPAEEAEKDKADPKADAERKASEEAQRKAKEEAERKAAEERARAETLRNARQARRTALRTALKAKLTKDMERYIYSAGPARDRGQGRLAASGVCQPKRRASEEGGLRPARHDGRGPVAGPEPQLRGQDGGHALRLPVAHRLHAQRGRDGRARPERAGPGERRLSQHYQGPAIRPASWLPLNDPLGNSTRIFQSSGSPQAS